MPDTPFVGPTYSLRSKPASVQRTVNMEPVPLEPGNERTGWVFKDVPGLVPVTFSVHTCFGGPIWSATTIPSNIALSIIYANGRFVASCKASGANPVVNLYSLDGVNWTAVSTPTTLSLHNVALAYGNGIFVCMTTSTISVLQSTDGITWTNGTGNPNVSRSGTFGLWFGNGQFVMCGSTTSTIFVSPNASNQLQNTTPVAFQTGMWNQSNGLHYAGAYVSGAIYTSPDLVTWTLKGTAYSGTASIRKIVSDGGTRMVALDGTTQRNFVSYSTDSGATWNNSTGLTGLPAAFYNDVIYVPVMDMWLLTDPNGTVFVSLTGGATWTVTTGTMQPILGNNNNWFMAATPNGFLYAAVSATTVLGTVAAVGIC